MRQAKRSLVLSSMVLASIVLASGAAQADKEKPKEPTTESVSLNFTKIKWETSKVDGSPGPSVNLEGVLHLVSRVFVPDDGAPVGFVLHTNLAEARASSIDGAEDYVAVGASDGIPAECQPASCAPPFWMLTFRLVPQGSGLQPSLVFNLTVKTEYDADGTLASACVIGQEGCDADILQ